MGRRVVNRGCRALVLAACVATVVALPSRPPVASAASTITTKLSNHSFESPRLAAGTLRTAPSGARWTFFGTAGIVSEGASVMTGVGGTPAGRQAAFVRDSGALQRVLSVAPGDALRFRATQQIWGRTGPQRLGVYVDTKLVATVTPGERTWTTHSVDLRIAARDVVTVEIRGIYAGEGQTRAAFVDAVSLTRRRATIAAGGLRAEERRAVVDPRSVPTVSGVSGITAPGDTHVDVDTPVQAFAEWGDYVFVGGKFSTVETTKGGRKVRQRFLAAFDRRTGAWIPTFRPVLDGAVWDLVTTPDGKLIVAGQFTSVNGVARTSALAALDPFTGEVIPGWRASLGLTGATDPDERPIARALDIEGDWIYVGGNFTRVTNADLTERIRGRLARVAVSDGRADHMFVPDVQQGTVNSVDATSLGWVWVAGSFRAIGHQGTSYARVAVAKLRTSDARPLPTSGSFAATIDERAKQFVHAILQVGNQVWVAGSQHMLQVYSADTFTLRRSWINFPIGDSQDLVELDGIVYVGTHAGRISRMFADARQWNSVAGATRVDVSPWLNAVDADDRTHLTGWNTDVNTADTEGAWALFLDSDRCLWAGGDFDAGSPTSTGRSYAQGFLRFCTGDTTAPATPSNTRATRASGGGVKLTWRAVSDTGRVRYEVFRNDRLVRAGIGRLRFTDKAGRPGDRYFVRAVDASGNRSATTAAVVAP